MISATLSAWVKQKSREDAVIFTAGVSPIPVSECLHPHLITHCQKEHHQSGGLVDVLAVERVPCPYPPGPVHHQCGSQRLIAYSDVEGEDVNPSVDTCKAVGSDIEVVLFVVEDFVKADRETRGRERLSWRDTYAEGWAFLWYPWPLSSFEPTKAPLSSHPRVSSISFWPRHPSYALWSLRPSDTWFPLWSRRSWIPSDTYRTWGTVLTVSSWNSHSSWDARRSRIPTLTFLSSLPKCATLSLIPLISLRT